MSNEEIMGLAIVAVLFAVWVAGIFINNGKEE